MWCFLGERFGVHTYSLISTRVAFAPATTWNFSGESESCPTVKAKFSRVVDCAHSGVSSEKLFTLSVVARSNHWTRELIDKWEGSILCIALVDVWLVELWVSWIVGQVSQVKMFGIDTLRVGHICHGIFSHLEPIFVLLCEMNAIGNNVGKEETTSNSMTLWRAILKGSRAECGVVELYPALSGSPRRVGVGGSRRRLFTC